MKVTMEQARLLNKYPCGRIGRWFAPLMLALTPFATAYAAAPTVKLSSASLADPGTAWTTFYQSSTSHTSGVLYSSTRPPEIKKLARSLGAGRYTTDQYASRVFDYVRLNIETEFRFGLGKGARGAVLDQSGTPFDQANLMVELLLEGGVTSANYKLGTLVLNATEFGQWTGLVYNVNDAAQTFSVDAKAACTFLADGGIPASINGSSSCPTSGTLSSVTMLHVWVEVNGKLYDPSYKRHVLKAGMDLPQKMGCGSQSAATCGSTINSAGMSAGSGYASGSVGTAAYVQNINRAAIETQLSTYAQNLASQVKATDRFAQLEDVAGGGILDMSYSPAIATTLPYASQPSNVYATWAGSAGIPDKFRTTLNVQFLGINSPALYLDELAGKRLRLGTLGPANTWTRTSTLYAELQQVATATYAATNTTPDIAYVAINHPYFARAPGSSTDGTYADETVELYAGQDWRDGNRNYVYSSGGNTVTINDAWANNITIVCSVGRSGEGTHSLMASLQATGHDEVGLTLPYSGGLDHHPTVAAGILAQNSAATKVLESVSRSRVAVHHTLGVVYAMYRNGSASGLFNVMSMASVTNTTGSATDKTAAFSAYSLLFATLEGSVPQQTEDGWDSASSTALLWRANEDHEKFFAVTNSTDYSGVSSTLSANGYGSRLTTISSLISSGYQFVLPEKGSLPCISMTGGSVCLGAGAEIISNATEVGYSIAERVKGDAAIPQADPFKSAMDATKLQSYSLRDRKGYALNAGDGTIVLRPAPDLVVGSGAYPASLKFQRTYSSSSLSQQMCSWYYPPGPYAAGLYCEEQSDGSFQTVLSNGWRHNFQISAEWTNNGQEAFGLTSGLRASTAIASLFAAFDLARAPSLSSKLAGVMVSHALAAAMMKNSVVVHLPEKSLTFMQLPDGSYDAPINDPSAQISLYGTRTGPALMGSSVLYDYSPTTLQYRSSSGDVMNFAYNSMTLVTAGNVYGFARPTYDIQDWTTPDGIKVKFDYTNTDSVEAGRRKRILTRVSNNLGHSLTFVFSPPSAPGVGTYAPSIRSVTDETGRVVYYDASGCSPSTYASVVLMFDGSGPAEDCRGTYSVTQADTKVTSYSYLPDSASPDPTGTVQPTLRLRKWSTPGGLFLTVTYDEQMHVKSVVDASGNTTSVFTGAITDEQDRLGEIQDATGVVTRSYFDRYMNPLLEIDGAGQVTANFYDNARRLKQTILPEGNGTSYQYDVRSNLLNTTRFSKTSSGYSSILGTQYTYKEGPNVQTCSNLATCNKAATITDANNNVTSIDYHATTGLPLTVTGQAFTNGISGNPLTTLCYSSYSTTNIDGSSGPTRYVLTGKIVRASSSLNRVTSYAYSGSHLDLSSATVDPSTTLSPGAAGSLTCTPSAKSGALNLVTGLGFDAVGNVQTLDGPRSDVSDITTFSYDKDRRLTRMVSPAAPVYGASATAPITRYTYDFDGELVTTRHSLVASPSDADPTNPWPSLTASEWQTETRTYWPTGDLQSIQDANLKVTQYAYDAVGRQALVTDPDGRVIGTVYDARGKTACTWKGWNSASAPTSCSWDPASYTNSELPFRYAAYSYTANGNPLSTTDANNNTTQMAYDGFDRLRFTLFPEANSGATCSGASGVITASTVPTCSSQQQTYEQYGYDNNDNRTSLRTRKGDVITSTFNPANLVDTKTVPSLSLVNYTYWLSGDPMGVTQGSHSTSYDYDDAGRVHSETNDGRQVVYGYDRAGNRQSTLWPDSYLASYVYDAGNKMQDVYEGTTSGSLIAHYDYDILSRRKYLTYAGNSANKVSYDYDANDNLSALSHQMASVGLSLGYGRNGSGQITSLSINDDFYLPRPTAASNTGYGVNRLNQYTAVGAIVGTESNGQPKIQGARGRFLTIPFDDLSIVIPSVGIGRTPVDSASDPGGSTVVYDLNGNMRRWVGSDGARNAYTYDAENRLRTATTSTHSVSYDYDARGRRISKTVDGVQTGYLLDGDEEIAEYNLSGGAWPSTPARRYVTGPGVDDRIAMVDVTNGNAKNYYHVNHQGSVLATTDSSGNVVQRLSYDEYGNLGSGSTPTGQVFRYTGRRFDAETGLYYYRARYYAPQIGRFLQTDPVGYKDDLNLYAYVGNDPLDETDPNGLYMTTCNGDKKCDAAAAEFEKQRQANLLSKDAAVVAAAQSYGDPGQENGVSVSFLTDKEMNAKYGEQTLGNTGATFLGSRATISVALRAKLKRKRMRATSAHEGTHVVQKQKLAASYNPATNKYAAAQNGTRLEEERQAYSAENVIDHLYPSLKVIDAFLKANYSEAKLNQPSIDPKYTE